MTDNTDKGSEIHTQNIVRSTCTEDRQRALLSLPPNNLAFIPPE
jgi:hypothetical protein